MGWGGGRRTPGFRGWWRGSFGAHGVRMGNQMGGGTMFRSGTRLFLAFLNRRWDALV